MGKDKKEKVEKQAASSSRGGVSMESKRSQRAAQSKRDSQAAREEKGWAPSARRKEVVLPKHRCKVCHNPSAVCRRGGQVCTRCGGSASRSRKRQAARDLTNREASARLAKAAPAKTVAAPVVAAPVAQPQPQAAA